MADPLEHLLAEVEVLVPMPVADADAVLTHALAAWRGTDTAVAVRLAPAAPGAGLAEPARERRKRRRPLTRALVGASALAAAAVVTLVAALTAPDATRERLEVDSAAPPSPESSPDGGTTRRTDRGPVSAVAPTAAAPSLAPTTARSGDQLREADAAVEPNAAAPVRDLVRPTQAAGFASSEAAWDDDAGDAYRAPVDGGPPAEPVSEPSADIVQAALTRPTQDSIGFRFALQSEPADGVVYYIVSAARGCTFYWIMRPDGWSVSRGLCENGTPNRDLLFETEGRVTVGTRAIRGVFPRSALPAPWHGVELTRATAYTCFGEEQVFGRNTQCSNGQVVDGSDTPAGWRFAL